jgi:hypothetical protein
MNDCLQVNGSSKRKVGRPPVDRKPLSLRVTPTIRDRLDAAAEQNGRSISQEAEFRLERSFDHQDLLNEVLEFAYGRSIADHLLTIGKEALAANLRD